MNEEILRELVGYDVVKYNDVEVMSEVAIDITTAAPSSPNVTTFNTTQVTLNSGTKIETVTATVEAFFKMTDTEPTTTVYPGNTFYYKVSFTNPDATNAIVAAEISFPQPTGVTLSAATNDSYTIDNTPGTTTIVLDNNTITIGGDNDNDNVPAGKEFVAWIQATVPTT